MDSHHPLTRSRRLRFEPLESRRVLSITVDTLVDENNGVGAGAGTSLREAIAAAAAGDTIDFSVTGTMDVLGQLVIDKNLTIAGPGANLLTLSAHDPTPDKMNFDGTRLFFIGDNNGTNLLDVSISGLTLTGGDPGLDGGGAIWTSENTVVSDCVIVNNRSGSGGTQYPGGGAIQSIPVGGQFPLANSLTVRNSVLSGNSSIIEGGAIRKRFGTLIIEDCTISGNTANYGGGLSAADNNVNVQIIRSTFGNNRATSTSGYGGGIFVLFGSLSIAESTISGNTAARGGGINPSGSSLTVTDSVISNNSATQGDGGGIWSPGDSVSIARSTIAGNSATGSGGGIYAFTVSMTDSTVNGNTARIGGGLWGGGTIVNSTFSGNSATNSGAISRGLGTLVINSSTITANTSGAGSGAVQGGTFQSSIISGNIGADVGTSAGSNGYNIVGTGNAAVGAFNKPGDQTGVTNPVLGPLADNGGPTKTHAPLDGSPAIDTGDPSAVAGSGGVPANDQRGAPFTRVYGGRMDKGAVERQPILSSAMGDYNQDGVVEAGDYLVWQKSRGATEVTPYTGADGTGDGNVDQADYRVWRQHYGSTVPVAGAGSGASIEEVGMSLERSLVAAAIEQASDELPLLALRAPIRDGFLAPESPGSFGQAGSGARIWALAKRVAPQVLRDDALVAWVESAGRVRKSDAIEFAINRDSREISSDESRDAFDAAVGELMSAAL